VVVRRPLHRAEDRPAHGRTDDPAAVHRHDGRGLQRRVVPGTEARGVGPRIRGGVGPRAPAAARSRLGTRGAGGSPARRDLRHERRLRPGGDPAPAHDQVHGHPRGCVRGARTPARDDRPRLPRLRRHRDPLGNRQQRHAVHDARVSARRDRADRTIPARGARPPHGREAQPDPAREGGGPRHPARAPRLQGDRHSRRGVRSRPAVRPGAGADLLVEGNRRRPGPHLRRQADQHAGHAEPRRMASRRRDVHVGPCPLPGHDDALRPAPARLRRRPPCFLFGGRRRGERRDHPPVRRPARHGVHGLPQARRLCPHDPVGRESGWSHAAGGRDEPGRLVGKPALQRGGRRGGCAEGTAVQEERVPLRSPQGRVGARSLGLRGCALRGSVRGRAGRAGVRLADCRGAVRLGARGDPRAQPAARGDRLRLQPPVPDPVHPQRLRGNRRHPRTQAYCRGARARGVPAPPQGADRPARRDHRLGPVGPGRRRVPRLERCAGDHLRVAGCARRHDARRAALPPAPRDHREGHRAHHRTRGGDPPEHEDHGAARGTAGTGLRRRLPGQRIPA